MLNSQDNLDMAHLLMETGDEMNHIPGWDLVSLIELESERSDILEELGMALAVYLLEREQ